MVDIAKDMKLKTFWICETEQGGLKKDPTFWWGSWCGPVN